MPQPNFFLIGSCQSGTTSMYQYLRQHPDIFMSATKEPNFFAAEALAAESDRIRCGWNSIWHYRRCGCYTVQLRRYRKYFEPRQLRIYLHDDWMDDNLKILEDVFDFLGVDDSFRPNVSVRFQVGGWPRSRKLHAFLHKAHPLRVGLRRVLQWRWLEVVGANMNQVLLKEAPPIPAATHEELIDHYRAEVMALQDLIGRDLSSWLTPASPG